MREMTADILVVGGGTGGVAAALAACRNGARVILSETTDWIGGQYTAQGVPPDENQWVETVGCSRSQQALREGVRRWYRAHRPLSDDARGNQRLNPGGGWVSRLCAEPRVWHSVMMEMIRPHVESGRLRVLLEHEPVAAETDGDRVRSVTLQPCVRENGSARGSAITVTAKFVLDATEWGDVLELAGVEHAIGGEHQNVYGELHARSDKTHPMDQQACSWCFAIEHRPGEDHVISRPGRYEFWKSFVPEMRDGSSWTGPLFSWTVPSHNAEGRRTFRMVPWPDEPAAGEWEMWRYRRIVGRGAYQRAEAKQALPSDVALINMVQMDYWLRPLLGVSRGERDAALAEAQELSRSLLYWMQTDAPRHDGGTGYPGLKLRGEELGTNDGLAKHVYVREPRRLIARTIMTEAHVGTEQRERDGKATRAMNWSATPFGTGERFADSVGIGHYTIDLHPSCAGRNSVYVPCAPFRVPMGALIPKRVRNVLASGKCLGVSHVVNGATRMHTTEWHIGEAAGTLAAWCVANGKEPHWVADDLQRVRAVQDVLARDGAPMSWPWET